MLIVAAVLLGLAGCDSDETSTSPVPVSETEVLVNYLEANGDYVNTSAPSIVTASVVFQDLYAQPPTQYIIDTRAAADFTAGHIEGAHNVPLADILDHVRSITASSYNRIVVVCYSGQTAAYGASILRLMGYSNVFSMKFGMSAWDSVFAATKWSANCLNTRAMDFVSDPLEKNSPGSLPVLTTGETQGAAILEERVNNILTEGYGVATITEGSLFSQLSDYYIVNYWPAAEYTDPGHIPGAVQYTPKADLKLSTYLKTLPTDKPIVVYCYTGQTSSYVVAYLRVLGYDARSLLYGANAMIYDIMLARGMTTFKPSDIMGYPYVTGS